MTVYVAVSLTFLTLVSGYSLQDVQRLKQDLFQNWTYDTKLRPIYNQSRTMQVNVSLTVSSIGEVNLAEGVVNLIGYLTVAWMDELLQWNSSDYNGIQSLLFKSTDIWTPKLVQQYDLGRRFPLAMATMYSSGFMAWFPVGSFRGICDQNMRYYPFDRHTCTVGISPSEHFDNEMVLVSTIGQAKMMDSFAIGGQWRFKSSTARMVASPSLQPDTNASVFQVSFVLERRPEFLIIHISIPFSLIVLLNMVAYLTPLASGERISFCITLMLAVVFYTTKISEMLPDNSIQVSYVSIFTLMSNIFSAASVAISVVLCNVANIDTKPVSPWLIRLISKGRHNEWKTKTIRMRKMRNAKGTVKAADDERKNNVDVANAKMYSGSLNEEKYPMNKDITWKHVAEYFDKGIFYCNLLVTLSSSLTISFVILFGA